MQSRLTFGVSQHACVELTCLQIVGGVFWVHKAPPRRGSIAREEQMYRKAVDARQYRKGGTDVS